MKTTAIILAMMFAVITAGAMNIGDPTYKETKLKKQVSRLVEFPSDKSIPEGASVSVEFELQEDGSILITDISGQPELIPYVKAKLENYAVKKMKELVGEKFYYRFVFKR